LASYGEFIAGDNDLTKLFRIVNTNDEASSEAVNAGISADNAEAFTGEKISSDLRELIAASGSRERVDVILQTDDLRSEQLRGFLKQRGVLIDSRMSQLGTMKVSVPVNAIEELAASKLTNHLSPDRTLESFGHVTTTTGTDQIRTQSSGLLGIGGLSYDGLGIGIAILDSGLDTDHKSFRNSGLLKSRVLVNKNFTTENTTDDNYGHGTHVTSTASGISTVNGTAYEGIAPNANIISLRVLNSKGSGTSSSVLNALNWILAPADPTRAVSSSNPLNKDKYGIRVVNMSLGAPAIDSYRDDPLCRAVRKLVDANIVVVAAAGNNGKNSAGEKVYGSIHSPGNEPSAITVGAVNTYGTNVRSDDGIASYSSRGPTRSRWIDASGVKHYDNIVKPDLVAPGNRVVYAQAQDNLLVTQHPELDARVSNSDEKKMMYLSGTSMATPVVAGSVALMLQANPKLTPNMVKVLLAYTAQPLAGYNMFEQGAGELNVEGAIRLAKLVRTNISATTPTGDPLLTTSTPPTPETTIAGQTFTWAQGLVVNHGYATGTNLIMMYQKIYGLGVVVGDGCVMGDGVVTGDGVVMGDVSVFSDGVVMGDLILTSNGVVMGDGVPFLAASQLIGDGIMISDGVVLGDGVVMGDGVVVGDGVVMGDSVVQAMSAMIGGDNTPGMR
jgi:subtilisin family serine protease